MKPSIYNSYIPLDEGISFIYNAFSDKTVIFRQEMPEDKSELLSLPIESTLYTNLVDSGCIVDESVDELQNLKDAILEADNNVSSYTLIVNPTLNCNFKCWYCYESHITNSMMSDETVDALIMFTGDLIKSNNDLKDLNLSFFGGEPFIGYSKVVKKLLTRISGICSQKDVRFSTHFTTNGYLINEDRAEFLKDYDCSFQITLDGHRLQHDNTRSTKDGKGSYDQILRNIMLLTSKGMNVLVRINCTVDNIDSIQGILEDLNMIPEYCKKRISFDFQRVWQDSNKDPDGLHGREFSNKIYIMLERFINKGFAASSVLFMKGFRNSCYADKINQMTVNYDGGVYKCTARDFNEKNRLGRLCNDGTVLWDRMHPDKRYEAKFSDPNCHRCRIAPLCGGGCSQMSFDRPHSDSCPMGYSESQKDDMVLSRFKHIHIDIPKYLKI
ncbi:radical SAM protein [uncultured Duncaniella sp.]|nr:radical SAM protein [uncultured Duncaniella sp.]